MNKTIRYSAAAVAMAAAMGMSSVAHADTATADATAEVLEALVLTNTNDLDFGAMVSFTGIVTFGALAADTAPAVSSPVPTSPTLIPMMFHACRERHSCRSMAPGSPSSW